MAAVVKKASYIIGLLTLLVTVSLSAITWETNQEKVIISNSLRIQNNKSLISNQNAVVIREMKLQREAILRELKNVNDSVKYLQRRIDKTLATNPAGSDG